MGLGEKVMAMRTRKGMNQKELAEASGITQATISRVESGQVKELKSEALKGLATALGVSVDYLIDKTKKMSPDETLDSDPEVARIFRGLEKLSDGQKQQVRDFVVFLEKDAAKKRRKKARR